jgi:hypothetical protein
MKVGDLVMFKESHWNRGGFEYCGKWKGLVIQVSPVTICWTTEEGLTCISDRRDDDLATEVEVISENR